jgi:hypothetical protein
MMDRAARRARQYMIVAFVGFTLFGVGLGFYATPSTDAALSNVPGDKAGTASGIYKMASSLGAAFRVAISAVLFTALSGLESQSGTPSAVLHLRPHRLPRRFFTNPFAASACSVFNVARFASSVTNELDRGIGRGHRAISIPLRCLTLKATPVPQRGSFCGFALPARASIHPPADTYPYQGDSGGRRSVVCLVALTQP